MVLNQTKFCMKCHKTRYFCIIFQQLKYQNQIFNFNYVIEITARATFKVNFFKSITFHFYNAFLILISLLKWKNGDK